MLPFSKYICPFYIKHLKTSFGFLRSILCSDAINRYEAFLCFGILPLFNSYPLKLSTLKIYDKLFASIKLLYPKHIFLRIMVFSKFLSFIERFIYILFLSAEYQQLIVPTNLLLYISTLPSKPV